MFTRKLGKSGIEVSAVGMGCWAIGGPWTFDGHQAGWGQVDDAESIRAIHRALELGINFFDTAANYGCGHSERLLGRALADRRDQVVIATKFGYNVDEDARNVTLYGDPRTGDVVSALRADCEASLHRLNTDVIDLYQFHVGGYDPEKAAGVRDALENLVAEGKIRFYGWSTDSPQGARVFARGEHCAAIQYRLNVAQDAPELVAVCDEFDLAGVIRGPLGRGVLTGKYTPNSQFPQDDHRGGERFRDEWFTPMLEKLDAVREVLTSQGRTLAQGTLSWVWARSERVIPIPGFKTIAQVEENAGALAFGPLDGDQIQHIDQLLGR